MTRQRLAEFNGPEQLAEASYHLLHDPSLDAALVHNVTTVKIHNGFTNLYEDIPQTHELDSVVHEWWKEVGYETRLPEQMRTISDSSQDIPAHFDATAENATFGPLMMTIRAGDHPERDRVFYVRRSHFKTYNVRIDQPTLRLHYMANHFPYVMQGMGTRALTRVVQRPYSATLWRGHPFGSLHGVKANGCSATIACHTL